MSVQILLLLVMLLGSGAVPLLGVAAAVTRTRRGRRR